MLPPEPGDLKGLAFFGASPEEAEREALAYRFTKGQGPEIVLAIGQGFTGKLMRTIGGGIAILFGSGAVGIGIAVVTFRKRRRAI